MTSGIYKIQSISHPDRIYIGSTFNIEDRWRKHLYDLRRNKHHSPKLQQHYNKHGEADLQFIIIEPCLPEFLIVREDTYLKPLPYFNICPKAGSCLGIKRTKEQNDKRKGQNTWMLGSKQSEETKNKKRIAAKNVPAEVWKRIADKRRGRKHSEETKAKISKALMNHGFSEESILKMTKSRQNISEETRQKLRDSHLKYYEQKRLQKAS
jgi:group I intron endonuclease